MEAKVCTYTEANIRLQLVHIDNGDGDPSSEIRLNRKVLFHVPRSKFGYNGTLARLMFLYYIQSISIDRNSNNLLKLTL